MGADQLGAVAVKTRLTRSGAAGASMPLGLPVGRKHAGKTGDGVVWLRFVDQAVLHLS
jgi:hypothetical protein